MEISPGELLEIVRDTAFRVGESGNTKIMVLLDKLKLYEAQHKDEDNPLTRDEMQEVFDLIHTHLG
tara:strand:- start:248 stop:445 length:198 start_codon:yes stop_codon:yes gene_type:complete